MNFPYGTNAARERTASHNRQTVALALVAVALLLIALAGWGADIEPREAARPLPHAVEGGYR